MLKAISRRLFAHLKGVNLIKIKFHILGSIADRMLRSGGFGTSRCVLFRELNSTIKTFVRLTFMKKGTSIERAVKAMNASFEDEACGYSKILKKSISTACNGSVSYKSC